MHTPSRGTQYCHHQRSRVAHNGTYGALSIAHNAGYALRDCETDDAALGVPEAASCLYRWSGFYAATSSPWTVNAQMTSIDIARTVIPHTV